MTKTDTPSSNDLESSLCERYGHLLHGKILWLTLGYVSAQSFRKAVRSGTVPVPIFMIENRRGRFAKTRDVAEWLQNLNGNTSAPLPTYKQLFDSTKKGGQD